MYDYIKLIINLSDDEILMDILIAELADAGIEAFDENDGKLNAYIRKEHFYKETFDKIFEKTPFSGIFSYSVEELMQENWNSVWESNFEPVTVDNKCVIYASFHNGLPETDYKILINPKMTFGTGHHDTTYLCVKAILDLDLNGKNVLDMGCGTGILGILSAMKGAANVTAIDNDPLAVENAVENAVLNGVELKMNIFKGEVNLLNNQKFDVIIANINRNVLLNDMEKYAASLLTDGLLIISGFFREDAELLLNVAKSLNLKKVKVSSRNGWTVITLSHEH
ncbi:MAG: 50S ribosomal protein L11 methyltransferase [Prevotellaceae bacterium]|jgi:ribosomal protein L11 methyltransferase|nr:50S ribosomal protein L11 methyltransferase [Prevotellaceae bacterium]